MGAPDACGGPDIGRCVYALYNAHDPEAKDLEILTYGPGDRGYCLPITSTGDAGCMTQGGYFAMTFKDGTQVCVPTHSCTGDSDCSTDCYTSLECPENSHCKDRFCVDDAGNAVEERLTCRMVPALGKKYCLDHAP